MGFFSKKRTSVYASTQHLSEANPDAKKDIVLFAILSGNSIAGSLINNMLSGMAFKVDSFLRYAENAYTLGLPGCAYNETMVLDDQVVADAIAADIAAPHGVVVSFNYVVPLLLHHTALPHLLSVRGWHYATGLVQNFPESAVLPLHPQSPETTFHKLRVISLVLDDTNTIATIDYEILAYYTRSEEDADHNRTIYTTELFSQTSYTESYVIPEGLVFGKDYCIAAYQKLDAEGTPEETINWWYYDTSLNLYPEIAPLPPTVENHKLLPVIPLRYDNQDLTREEVQDTDLYKTSKSLLKRIGVDFDSLGSKLSENPDVGEIDHAYLMFGVDLQTTNDVCIRYLVDFFDYLSDRDSVTFLDVFSQVRDYHDRPAGSFFDVSSVPYVKQQTFGTVNPYTPFSDPDTRTHSWIDINDNNTSLWAVNNNAATSLTEHGLDHSLTYSYIRSDIRIGSIGEVGAVSMEKVGDPDRQAPVGWDYSTLTLKQQISENAYKQVQVEGLVHRSRISGYALFTPLSAVVEDEDEHNLIVPIHYDIALKLPTDLRNQLYQESLLLVMNSIVVTRLKWYQTGFFRMITVIVSMVLIAYSAGQSTFLQQLTTLANASFQTIMLFLLENILVSIAVSAGVDFVAKQIGPELTMLLAAACFAVGALKNKGLGSFEIFSKEVPIAQSLMQVAGALVSGAQRRIEDMFGEIQEAAYSFAAEAEESLEKLEAAKELLSVPSMSSWNLLEAQTKRFVQPAFSSPSEFFDLTIHTGNIGTLTLDTIPNYHNIALKLPKPDTSFWA